MHNLKKQTNRLGKNVQQLIDLINKQQSEMQELKKKYQRLKSDHDKSINRINPGQTLLSTILI